MRTFDPVRISKMAGSNVAHFIWKSAQSPVSETAHIVFSIALYMDMHYALNVPVDNCIYNSVYTSVFNFLYAYDGFS